MWDKIEKRSAMAVKDLSNKLQEVLRNLRKAKIGLEAATAKPSDTTDYEGGRKSALSAATNASAAEVQLINSIHKPDWYVNYKFEFNQMMSELIQAVKDQPQPQTSDNKPATKKPDASGVKPR
jgi:flagellar hook-basal body complex protein FliE